MKKLTMLVLLMLGAFCNAQKKLPNLSLSNLEGKNVSLEKDFAEKDKLYVFAFWATWCAPCIEELNEIENVYADWKSELNVEVVAVSIDDSRTVKRVKPLVNGKGWEYVVLYDSNQDFKRALGISNPPYIAVVKNGEIVYTQNGHTPGSEVELFEKLKTLK